jgi:endonuclease/exonuclease/phosphatase family metal-dependent hydrolase
MAHFAAQLPFSILGTQGNFFRGYEWADLDVHGVDVRVVNPHFEAYYQPVAAGQAAELAQSLAAVEGPVLLTGDLNSSGDPADPGAAYALLTGSAGFTDVWLVRHRPSDPGDTCCNDPLLDNSVPAYDERIDFVMSRGPVREVLAYRVGVSTVASQPPYWPSDHAGVFATVVAKG